MVRMRVASLASLAGLEEFEGHLDGRLEDAVARVLDNVAVTRDAAHLLDAFASLVRRQEDDGQLAARQDAAGRLGAVDALPEVNIHEDEVDAGFAAGQLHRPLAIGGPEDPVAETLQRLRF